MVALLAMMIEQPDRVADAYKNKLAPLQAHAKAKGLNWPLKHLYMRAFKDEKKLELWVRPPSSQSRAGSRTSAELQPNSNRTTQNPKYVLWKTYKVAAASGELGPKRVEGDLQVPEGFYRVVVFNNQSRFHLSLGLNYPNASDRIRSDKTSPGGDIYVHGRRASIGCLAMTDPIIEEIYVMAYEAKKAGNAIPVHIFPSREIAVLSREYPQFANFWAELAPAYTYFERTRLLPRIRTDARGRYIVN